MARGAVKAGEAYVELGIKSSIDRGLKAAQAKLLRTGGIMSGAAVAALAGPVMAAARGEDVFDKFNTVFGDSAEEMDKWAKTTARAMGMSRGAMRGMLSSTQDLLVPMGVAPKHAENLSKEIAKLSVDIGSFNNVPVADVQRDINNALTGSGETMKKYGVIVNEASVKQELLNMGLDPKNVDNAAKAQARYNIIMAGTQAAQGDALRTSDSFNNRMQALQSSMADLAATVGGPLLDDTGFFIATLTTGINAVESFAASNTVLIDVVGKLTIGVGLFGAAMVAAAGSIKAVIAVQAGWNALVVVSTNVMKVYRSVVLTVGAAYTLYTQGTKGAAAATIMLAAAQKQNLFVTKAATMAMAAMGTVTTIFSAAGGGLVGVLAVMKAGLLAVAGAAATAWTAVLGPLVLIVAAIGVVVAAVWGLFKAFQKIGEVRERLAVNESGVGFRDESLVDSERLAEIEAEIEQERQARANAEKQRMDELRSKAEAMRQEWMSGAEKRKAKMAEIAELEKEGLLTAEEAERARQEAFTSATKALQQQIRELEGGEEAALRWKLANDGLTESEIAHHMALKDKVATLEQEKEYDARMLALQQELDLMKMTTDEATKQKFINEGFTDAQAEKLAGLEKELELEKEKTREAEKQKREQERAAEKRKKDRERELQQIASTYEGVKQGLETERETAQRNHDERMKAIGDAWGAGKIGMDEANEQRLRSEQRLQKELDGIREKATKKQRDELKKTADKFKSVVQSLETEQEGAQRQLAERLDAIREAEAKGVASPEQAAQARLRARAAFNKEMAGDGATVAGTFSSIGAMLLGGGRGGSIQERQLAVQERIAENTDPENQEKEQTVFGA